VGPFVWRGLRRSPRQRGAQGDVTGRMSKRAHRFRCGMIDGKRGAGMEDLILAFVTFVASMFILSHLAGTGMDAFTIVMFVASIPLVGYLAYERGRSHRRWAYVAAVIGPFAIPMLYCVAAISACRHRTGSACRSKHGALLKSTASGF
jgi:hypothetical protein